MNVEKLDAIFNEIDALDAQICELQTDRKEALLRAQVEGEVSVKNLRKLVTARRRGKLTDLVVEADELLSCADALNSRNVLKRPPVDGHFRNVLKRPPSVDGHFRNVPDKLRLDRESLSAKIDVEVQKSSADQGKPRQLMAAPNASDDAHNDEFPDMPAFLRRFGAAIEAGP